SLAAAVMTPPAVAQVEATDLVVRLDRLEQQIRQLTGTIEQLEYRNQQLEGQLRQLQQAGVPPQAGLPPAGPPRSGPAPMTTMQPPPGAPIVADQSPSPVSPMRSAPQRRADVFDPNENPDAPGAPRTLGSIPTANGPHTNPYEPPPAM